MVGRNNEKYPLITVGALIFNKKNKILFVKSNKWKGQYGIPAGKVHYGEKVVDGLKREIKEETNLDVYGIKFLLRQEIINPKDFFKKSHFVSLNYICKAKNTNVKLNNEAQSCKWVAAENALKLELNKPTKELVQYYLKAINKDKGSGKNVVSKTGTLSKAQLREIAEKKLPDLNAASLDAAVQTVKGTARSMGIEVV